MIYVGWLQSTFTKEFCLRTQHLTVSKRHLCCYLKPAESLSGWIVVPSTQSKKTIETFFQTALSSFRLITKRSPFQSALRCNFKRTFCVELDFLCWINGSVLSLKRPLVWCTPLICALLVFLRLLADQPPEYETIYCCFKQNCLDLQCLKSNK